MYYLLSGLNGAEKTSRSAKTIISLVSHPHAWYHSSGLRRRRPLRRQVHPAELPGQVDAEGEEGDALDQGPAELVVVKALKRDGARLETRTLATAWLWLTLTKAAAAFPADCGLAAGPPMRRGKEGVMLREGQGRQIEKKVKSWAFAVKSSALIECLSAVSLSCFVYSLGDLQENIKSSQILAGEQFFVVHLWLFPFLGHSWWQQGQKGAQLGLERVQNFRVRAESESRIQKTY